MYIKGMIKALLDIACLLIVCWVSAKLFDYTINEIDIAAALAVRAIVIHYTDFEQLKEK